MRKLLYLLVCVLLLCGCAASPVQEKQADMEGYPCTFTDDTGTEVTLTAPPKKVAVLLSSLADLWITAGGTVDITVGETVDRGYVPETVLLVDDGAGKTINIEALVAAEPDLVLYASDLAGQLECADTLAAANIPAAGFAIESFGDYLKVLKIATDILGTPENFETNGVQVEERIKNLIALAQEKGQTEQPQILFVRVGSTAKVTKAKTAQNHFVCDMLDELGTYNIADNAPVLLDGLATEEILRANPDFIFYTTMGKEDAAITYMDSLLTDPVWQEMDAVKEGRVYLLPKDLFQYKPNARWAEAYEYLVTLLYGEIQ